LTDHKAKSAQTLQGRSASRILTLSRSNGIQKIKDMNTLTQFQVKAQRVVRKYGELWKKPAFIFTTGVDTEYVQKPNNPNTMLTSQFAISIDKEDCLVLEHPSLGIGRLPVWDGETALSTVLGWEEAKGVKPVGYLVWEHMMFFAPSDLLAGCFRDRDKCLSIQAVCKQDARIRLDSSDKTHPNLLKLGIFLKTPLGVLEVVLKVLDFGKLAVGGLAQTVSGLGGKMLDKNKMDKYKTNMLDPYQSEDSELFNNYVDYAKDDACQMFFLREANADRTKTLFDAHGLDVPDREIVTTGSLVAELFQSFVEKKIGSNKFYEFFKYKNIKGVSKHWQLESMLERSTVTYFAEKSKETKKVCLALVQGGRAKNEQPLIIKQEGVIADIDISGAYVSIQKVLTYPVGLPCTYGQHESSNKVMTLGRFIQQYGSELIPRLWFAVVTGTLEHTQTLVASKVIESVEISDKWNEETCNIPADFRLYTREIKNGVITSDVLETLRNVCSNKEYSEYMKLEVQTAAWYPKSLRCETSEEAFTKTEAWVAEHGNSVNEIVTAQGETRVKDNRSRYWLAISLNEFLSPYASKRKELKKAMQSTPKGSEEYNTLDAQQNAMKLVGNTNYGVLASPFFKVGNVVIANNITAIARTAVWLTGVALSCVQTVTDGGGYDLNNVRTWNGQKPSMNTLSLLRSPDILSVKTRRSIQTKPLGLTSPWSVTTYRVEGKDLYTTLSNGTDTYEAKEGGWSAFDKLALEHIRDFFKSENYHITLLDFISYEHKDMYVKALYHSQTNYQFLHATGIKKTKARGHKLNGKPYEGEQEANILRLFEDLDKTPNSIPPYRPQYISSVLKVNQANLMAELKVPDNVFKTNNLLAGDSILKSGHLRPISLSPFHWQTDAQYTSWETNNDSLKNRTGYGVEQFFLNPDGTCRYQEAIETIQERIDNSDNWLFPLVKGKTNLCSAYHPYFVNPA
jgi:hypothetical protein